MNSIDNILSQLKTDKELLKKAFGVKSIGVFGSYVRNEQKKKSDLDILVEFSITPGMFKFIELEDHLTKKLGVKVDLVMKSALKPYIGQQILKEVLYV